MLVFDLQIVCRFGILLVMLLLQAFSTPSGYPFERRKVQPATTAINHTKDMDKATKQLIASVKQKYSSMRSLKGTFSHTGRAIKQNEASAPESPQGVMFTGEFCLAKPNRYQFTTTSEDGESNTIQICDGNYIWRFDKIKNRYRQDAINPKDATLAAPRYAKLNAFFLPTQLEPDPLFERIKYIGKETRGGIEYDVLQLTPVAQDNPGHIKYYVSPQYIILGEKREFLSPNTKTLFTEEIWLSDIQVDYQIAETDFKFEPPASATLYTPKKPNNIPDNGSESLLPLYSMAPNFVLNSPQNQKIDLSKMLRSNKLTLINFWYYGCGHCHEEFPHMQRLFMRLKAKGLGVVAINTEPTDSNSMVIHYMRAKRYSFPVAMQGKQTAKLYKVDAGPVNYLVDEKGRIIWRHIGYNPDIFQKLTETVETYLAK